MLILCLKIRRRPSVGSYLSVRPKSVEMRSVQTVQNYAYRFRSFLNQPFKVFVFCMAVLVLSLFLNGTVWRIWGLRRDLSTIQQQIISSREQSKHLDLQIKQAKDPSFIERQAKDKLDMVGEQDLVFVFTDGPQN